MTISRRSLLLATAALPLAPLGAFAADVIHGARVGFSVDGHKFGVVVTQRADGVLVTVRSLSGKFEAVGLVKPKAIEGAKEVRLTGGGRSVSVAIDANENLVVEGGGVRLTSLEPVPPPAQPEPQGLLGRLIRGIKGALEAIAVGIAAGLAWLLGAEFHYSGRNFSIWVTGRGGDHPNDIKLWIHGTDNGVVPPPDDVDEDPTVWY